MARIEYDSRVAAAYDVARGYPPGGLEAWRDAVAPHFAHAPAPIADVGSGTGLFAEAFASWFGVRVIGVEPSAGMRGQAAEKRATPLTAYVAGDAHGLPLRDSSCAHAWLSTVVHHLRDLAAAAREVRRVVAPGGRALVRSSFPGRHEQITLFRLIPAASRVASTFPTVEQTAAAFESAGFSYEGIEEVAQVSASSRSAFLERVRLRADTTLVSLTDDEYAAGVAAVETWAAEQPDEPVVDELDLLVFG